ncbi:MAG: sugar phosphate isomerase/epimerase [Thermomicrobiales bacterium]|nr:sugar phosphate isomerase/epimerase [Thermomicrobiales bacterium]
MKLGLLTAALPKTPLTELAPWAAESGFDMLEIACWPLSKSDRRYGGVTHIDVDTLDKAGAKEIVALMTDNGLEISALAYYPNILGVQGNEREAQIAHLKKVIDAAVLLEVPIVGTFIGADMTTYADENLEEYARVWPAIVKYAAEREIKIAIENCPMLWDDTWPGGQNLAYSPSIWTRMFEIIPDDNFGLNYDPSHLIWQFIDEIRPITDFRTGSSMSMQRTCGSTGKCSIGTGFWRLDSAGRFHDCPDWARFAGPSSWRRSMRSATTT